MGLIPYGQTRIVVVLSVVWIGGASENVSIQRHGWPWSRRGCWFYMPSSEHWSERRSRAITVAPMDRPDLLHFTESEEANRLLATDGLALLIGMLLDQQFPMERAFFGPQLLKERIGEELDAARIATWDPDELEGIFKGPPAIHRYPGSMAKRTQALCQVVMDEYEGRAENIWETASDGDELLRRLKALPGFGDAKSRVFVGVLGKRLGLELDGWKAKAADWPSIADVAAFDDVTTLREQKRAMKAEKKG